MLKWFRRGKKGDSAASEPAPEPQDIPAGVEEPVEAVEAVAPAEDDAVVPADEDISALPADEEAAGAPPEEEGPANGKKGFLARLKERLAGTRAVLNTRVDHLLLGVKQIDEDVLEELEEVLITSDLGVKTTQALIKTIGDKVARKELDSPDHLKAVLREEMVRILSLPPADFDTTSRPHVILVIGVNGVGKTTTIAKLANRYVSEGRRVMLAAGDTFRAAAIEQLGIWSDRVGTELVRQQAGSDPSAVVFDALHAARSRGTDILIVDTAGRLHTKVNLMEELKKVHRVADREMPGAPHEVLLVLDATTGQNAVSQARLFNEVVGVHHIAMTKLDGTAKGGVLVSICHDLGLPIRYIGIGEGMDDLRDFDAQAFVEALFG
ncbi:MAG: signal recognition particle-docking protein FtsY [Proteobacteria bacterium]|nr:signal recognition particle-docking protein FtsY [Pseudomonadota bacterium]